MVAKIGTQYYVGPDNGTITLLLEKAAQEGWETEFIDLNNPNFWLPEVSFVFHGRDIFAPVAAHLSMGTPLESLGTPFENPVRLELPQPEKTDLGWRGQIIHVDHFGNLSSSIRVEHLGEALKNKEKINVRVGAVEIQGLVNTFGERAVGELIALIGSTGNLIVSVVNGSASERLAAKLDDLVEVVLD
jgi:S-adenosylmethionine hydrolase